MRCSDAQQLVHAYFDGELDLIRSLEVERHLRECAPCSGALQRHRALRERLRAQDVYEKAPAALLEKLTAQPPFGSEPQGRRQPTNGHAVKLAEPERTERRPVSRWWMSGIAAAIVVAASTVTWFASHSILSRDALVDQLVSSHVHSLLADHLTDVESSDRHTVKPWFSGKLDFAPNVRDLSSEGFPLVGGRLDYLNGRPVAAMVYHRNKHVINLFVWPAGSQSGERSISTRGYNLIVWRDAGGMTCCAVSDVSMEELEQFAALLRKPG
jgi:anti-sigma factor RsiW